MGKALCNRLAYKPWLETLEPRLPPGETGLYLIAGLTIVDFDLGARGNFSIGTGKASAEQLNPVPDFLLEEKSDRSADLRVGHQSTSNTRKESGPNEVEPLKDPLPRRVRIGSGGSFSAGLKIAEEIPTIVARGSWSIPIANFTSIPSGLAGVGALPSPTGVTSAAAPEGDGYSTPFYFEKNMGQEAEGVDFVARRTGYKLTLSATEAILALQVPDGPEGLASWDEMRAEQKSGLRLDGRLIEAQAEPVPGPVVQMQVVGGNPHAQSKGVDQLVTKINYFIGNDPNYWYTNVPTFGRVQYEDVYPGIDLVYYSNQQELEYDFVVAPGVDPKQIQLNFTGADYVQMDAQGNLIVQAGDSKIIQHAPYIYQELGGGRQQVAGSFIIGSQSTAHGGFRVGFEVGHYDPTRPLVIDPMVVDYSTYLGSSGNDYGYDIAVDAMGNAYVAGRSGNGNAFVSKFSQDGSTLLYSTYIGGSYLDSADAIALAKDSAYITGFTESDNFPTTSGVFQPTIGQSTGVCEGDSWCADAFVVRLSADGASMLYSTFLGVGGPESGEGIAVDAAGNAYVLGMTNSDRFHILNAAQPTYGGGGCTQPGQSYPCFDDFVTKLNPTGSALVYSTYLGGNGDEAFLFQGAGNIAIDPAGYAYVTGYTKSANFPLRNPIQETKHGIIDAFITKLSPDGSSFVYSTYLGGSLGENGRGIIADAAGNAYVTGETYSDNFPTTPQSFQPTKPDSAKNGDAFVVKLPSDGSEFAYSTYLGGAVSDGGNGVAVDAAGNAYIVGFTGSLDFPIRNPFQSSLAGGDRLDAFVTKLSSVGDAIIYSTYLGGSDEGQSYQGAGSDTGKGIALDSFRNAYIAGSTFSLDFPVAHAWQSENAGYRDAFVAKISRFVREEATVVSIPVISP
jgi:hypothetical protein